jgi:hypothetical protein
VLDASWIPAYAGMTGGIKVQLFRSSNIPPAEKELALLHPAIIVIPA